MRIRPNTWDSTIAQNVLVDNEYALPVSLQGCVILDIGAHIGSFAIACQKRNAKIVACYEPDAENFEILRHNVAEDVESRTSISIYNAAVTGESRLDLKVRQLRNHDFDKGRNTGHVDVFGVIKDGDETLNCIRFDEAVSNLGYPIDILKLDCEGAEWEIFDKGDFSKIKTIAAELHAVPSGDHPALTPYKGMSLQFLANQAVRRLEESGFQVAVTFESTETAKLIASKRATINIEDGTRKPKLLWIGDAVITTGFARVNESICRRLVDSGWEVRALGIGYNGDPHNLPYKVYPAIDANIGGARNGMSRIRSVVDSYKPDVIVIHDDSWNVGLMIDNTVSQNITTPTVGYIAVDSENVRSDHAIQMRNLKHAICHTNFGVTQIVKAGYTGPTSVMPHGVDNVIYQPYDRTEARSGIPIKDFDPEKAFIWGFIGMNQPRKRLDLAMAYWMAWWESEDRPNNAYLYMHTLQHGAWDLRQLKEYLGIPKGRMFETEGGQILKDNEMPSLYSAFDAMISTSEGESFGIPTLESMACGIPNIQVDCGGARSWAGDAVYWVKPSQYVFTANPTNTKRWIASEENFVQAMHDMYSSKEMRDEYTKRGLARAAELNWDDAGIHFDKVLRNIIKTRQTAVALMSDALSEF